MQALRRKLDVVLLQILPQKPIRAFARIRPQQYPDAGFTLRPLQPSTIFSTIFFSLRRSCRSPCLIQFYAT